jgi:peptidoglycan hydrolase-like protein with peptidoglycan-binding domain
MEMFRGGVTAILNGTAPPPTLIPRVDDKDRPTLRRGATGPDVARLQQLLGVVGPDTFGPRTEAAVREFQRQHDLVPDGIVGPNTWKALAP